MSTIVKIAGVLLTSILLAGCSKDYPADSGAITYANRTSPGSELKVKSVLVPDKMNIVYFYADW
jgi:hypothetical protein